MLECEQSRKCIYGTFVDPYTTSLIAFSHVKFRVTNIMPWSSDAVIMKFYMRKYDKRIFAVIYV